MGEEHGLRHIFSHYRYFWIAFGVVLLDQLLKLGVKFSMRPYEEVKVFGEFFKINFIENKGAAFGLTISDILQKVGYGLDEDTAKMILSSFSVLAVIVILFLLRSTAKSRGLLPIFLSLILGGAVGNIIDRVFYGVWFAGINDYEGGLFHGRVVDMFYVDLVHGEYGGINLDLLPVFNLADAAIGVGILAIILMQRRLFKQWQDHQDSPAESLATDAGTETEVPE